MNLAVLIIGTVERLEGDQFRRIRREVRCVLLVLLLCRHMLDFVGGTVEFSSDEPRTGEGIDKFINLPAPGVRLGRAMSKNGVVDRVNLRVGSSCVDEFPMISLQAGADATIAANAYCCWGRKSTLVGVKEGTDDGSKADGDGDSDKEGGQRQWRQRGRWRPTAKTQALATEKRRRRQ